MYAVARRTEFPWFDLYDEHRRDQDPTKEFGKVKSAREVDQEKGFGSQGDDSSVEVSENQVKKLKPYGVS